MANIQKNTTYILGAGASRQHKNPRGESPPLIGEFIQKFYLIREHSERAKQLWDFVSLERFIEEFWGLSRTELESKPINIEELLSFLLEKVDEERIKDELSGTANRYYTCLVALHQLIRVVISETTDGTCDYMDSLYGHWKQQGCTIITFNYDLLVENAIPRILSEDQGIDYRKLYDYQNFDFSSSDNKSNEVQSIDPSINLLKLHGSINWYTHQSGSQTTDARVKYYGVRDVGNGPETIELDDNLRARVFLMTDVWRGIKRADGWFVWNFIISPQTNKDFKSYSIYLEVWKKALEELMSS